MAIILLPDMPTLAERTAMAQPKGRELVQDVERVMAEQTQAKEQVKA